jgi:purine-nucleoside phosphorylase
MEPVSLSVDIRDIDALRSASGLRPRVAIVLGSGLGPLADEIEVQTAIECSSLPGYPAPGAAIAGHGGRLLLGHLAGQSVIGFVGRVHRYQGVSALDVTWPVRIARELGAETLLVTNAAGGVDSSLAAGAVTLIADHLNLTGDSPLVGWPGPEGGTPFVPMGDAYDPALRTLAHEVAATQGLALSDVVYAGLLGPAYETPAEVAYLRAIGAQTVGMSTVPEVIVARALGMRVLGISLVTNVAGGAQLSHDEVLLAGKQASESLTRLVVGILARL